MRAGGLRRARIQILNYTEAPNDYGARTKSWLPYISTNADIDFISGSRRQDMYEMTTSYTVDFRIRIYHRVDESMRIRYKDKYYRIEAILPNEDKQMQTIVGKLINE